jgi:hypothetical protein
MMVRAGSLATALIICVCAFSDDPPREQIGEVLGKPIYRDQLSKSPDEDLESRLHELFIRPVAERYRAEHSAEVTPTEAEIAVAARYFKDEHDTRDPKDADELRAALTEIEARLTATDVPVAEQEALRERKKMIDFLLLTPERRFAEFMLSHWKFERHLYEAYGGGRVLWQQAGLEAFDATRAWLEAQEQRGAFKVTDARLRKLLYAYWTTKDHGAFLFAEKQRIRDEFLEPGWARQPSSQSTSRPSSAPASRPL